MADENVSIGLNTSGYEEPLKRLTNEMVAFNAATVAATAQQRQMAKIMTGVSNIYSSYAKVLVQTAKATAIAVEGPSQALENRFQNAQRVLANLDRAAKKVRETGAEIEKMSIVPKNMNRVDEAIAQRLGKALDKSYAEVKTWRDKVERELGQTGVGAAKTPTITKPQEEQRD